MSDFIPWNSQPLPEWAAQFAKGEFIELEGRLTHYVEAGTGEPVILLHGFGLDSCLWEPNMARLSEKFKVYAPDLWGLGYSTREPLDYGYALYADFLSTTSA